MMKKQVGNLWLVKEVDVKFSPFDSLLSIASDRSHGSMLFLLF
jgi:hypothetical protein